MASKAYIDTISNLAMAKILADYIWDVYSQKQKNKTMKKMCDRVKLDATTALHPYLYDASCCQYDAKAQKKVKAKIAKACRLFDDKGETMAVWVNFNLAALNDLLDHIKDSKRRSAIERLLYGVKAIARHIDRKQNDFKTYERADEFAQIWSTAS